MYLPLAVQCKNKRIDRELIFEFFLRAEGAVSTVSPEFHYLQNSNPKDYRDRRQETGEKHNAINELD